MLRENASSVPSTQDIEKALFDAALNLSDPETRQVFLARACGGDSAMRERLERLLATREDAERFFDLDPLQTTREEVAKPVSEPASVDEKTRDLAGAGVRIGRYKLLERMGEGAAESCISPNRRSPCADRSRSRSSGWEWTPNA